MRVFNVQWEWQYQYLTSHVGMPNSLCFLDSKFCPTYSSAHKQIIHSQQKITNFIAIIKPKCL